ncbi:MAG: hypothetical protein GY936_06560, partial [Ignavibacteriae bacterium]|nr:hypothetical protein [Ignavibacteriota bacterium]
HIRPVNRGIERDVINFVIATHDYIKKKWEAKDARYYNAEIYYEQRGGDEVINKVVFKRKS